MSKSNAIPLKTIDQPESLAAHQHSRLEGAALGGRLSRLKWFRWTLTFGVFLLSLMVSQVFAYSTVTLTAFNGTTTQAYTVAFTRELNQINYNTCAIPIQSTPWWGNRTLAVNLATALGGALGMPTFGTYGPLFGYRIFPAGVVDNAAWSNGVVYDSNGSGWPVTSDGVYVVDPRYMDASGNCTTAVLGTAKPVLTSLSPNTGRTAGGTTVTITGNNFTGTTGVTIGGVSVASFTVVSDTTLTVVTPAGTAGSKSVLITTSSGGTNVAVTPDIPYTYSTNNDAPSASSVMINGSAQAGTPLSGIYNYADAEGNPEGTSTFRWRTSTTYPTITSGVTVSTAQTYIPVSADNDKYLYFCVTPVASAGTTTGVEVCSSGLSVVVPQAVTGTTAPVASSVAVTGSPQVGSSLSGTYTFSDADGDTQGTSTFRWVANSVNTGVTGGTTLARTQTYTPSSTNLGSYLYFCVTPVSSAGTLSGTEVCTSATAAVTSSNAAPVASSVAITGTAQVGVQLSGSYTFSDADSDTQGTSTFRWIANTINTGVTGGTLLATSQNYTPTSASLGKYIYFCVTPVASNGTLTGTEVCSSASAAVVASSTALSTISNYVSGGTAPTTTTYGDAGVTGVNSTNLAGLNSFLVTLTSAQRDSTAEVQAMVNAYAAVQAAADGNASNAAPTLSAAQFAALGLSSIDSTTELSLLNDVIGRKSGAAVDTQSELAELASVVQRVLAQAAGTSVTPALTVDDLTSLGLTGVTSANLASVLAAITATADDGTGVDTVAELQALIDSVSTTAITSLSGYANGGNIPTVTTYGDAGVTGVNSTNLAGLNSFLVTLTSAQRDSTAEVQAMVNAYAAVQAAADGNASNAAPTLSAAQFAALGLSSIDSTTELSLLNDVIGRKSGAAVDTQSELAALASVVERVLAQAAGTPVTPALTVADLTSLGLTGVTSANLDAVLAAINATADNGSGVDTLSKLQAVVNSVVDGLCVVVAATAFAPPVVNLCSAGSLNGSVLAGATEWTWTCNGSGGGVSASCSAPFAPTATNGGSAHALVSGNSWEIDRGSSGFIALGSVATPPANVNFAQGLLSLRLINGTPGTLATVTINYSEPLPPGTVYWKYGKEPNNATPHWYQYPGAVISSDRKSITLTLKDGEQGDDDLTPDGVIVDPGGPGVSEGTAAIPTLSEWAMLFLASLMLLLGFAQMRRGGRTI